MRAVVLVAVLQLLLAVVKGGDLPAQECPPGCECHYFRVHWMASCAHRGFSQVPSGFAAATHAVDLAGNALTHFTLDPEVRLRRVSLADNNIETLAADSFKGLGFLIDVDVSGNKLHTIESDAFQDSPGLMSLQAARNKEYLGPGLDSPFLESRSLQTLDLSDCHVGVVGPRFFSGTPALRKIDLSGNPVREVRPGAFSTLQGLHELDLSNTLITHLAPATLAPDPPLRVLNLRSNRLDAEKLQALTAVLVHLERLDLGRCDLTLGPSHVETLARCDWLEWLDLSDNDLSRLDLSQALAQLRHLQHLDVSNCGLDEASLPTLANLTRLRTLKVADNSLRLANLTEMLKPLTRLHHLSVRNCDLDSTAFLRQLPKVRQSLRSLDLSRNPLGDDEINAAGDVFEHLEQLDVSFCDLTVVSRHAFSPARHLLSLSLSGNNVTFEDAALAELTKLQTLHVERCDLSGAPAASVFPPSSQLSELYLAGNPVDQVVPAHLSNLRKVDVSECNLRKLSGLEGAHHLTKLLAADNDLSAEDALPADLGLQAPNLEVLDLRRSGVRRVNADAVDSCKKLRSLLLQDNPLRCDCDLRRLERWAASRGVALHADHVLTQCLGQSDSLLC
ncbi:protein artichoke-like [Cloeon dipterum]|uniref:protein artichoke-like n=1 Tax=Cloeon dipterum TaxID=197152 RepID=UPI00321F6254